MNYKVFLARQAQDDYEVLRRQGNQSLFDNARSLLALIGKNPFDPYPPFKRLTGDLKGCYARRLNRQHRLVYQVLEDQKAVKVLSMWTHYGD